MSTLQSQTCTRFLRISLIWAGLMPLKNFKRYPGCVASLEETNKAICTKRKTWKTQQLIVKNGTKTRYQTLLFQNANVTYILGLWINYKYKSLANLQERQTCILTLNLINKLQGILQESCLIQKLVISSLSDRNHRSALTIMHVKNIFLFSWNHITSNR